MEITRPDLQQPIGSQNMVVCINPEAALEYTMHENNTHGVRCCKLGCAVASITCLANFAALIVE